MLGHEQGCRVNSSYSSPTAESEKIERKPKKFLRNCWSSHPEIFPTELLQLLQHWHYEHESILERHFVEEVEQQDVAPSCDAG
jgi:hypothetical protein